MWAAKIDLGLWQTVASNDVESFFKQKIRVLILGSLSPSVFFKILDRGIAMRKIRRVTSILLAITLLLSTGMETAVFAKQYDEVPLPPKNIRLSGDNAIGYTQEDGYYADIMWENQDNLSQDPNKGDPVVGEYFNFYLQEIGEKLSARYQYYERNIPNINNTTSYRLKKLKSGTVYYVDMTTYHTHKDDDDNIYSSRESEPSLRFKFLTKIQLKVEPVSSNEIKIIWDDVWDENESGKTERINYKLYISQDKSKIMDVSPIYIKRDQIGEDKAIKVNADGDLEYIHKFNGDVKNVAGRVYYVRIVPDTDNEVFQQAASDVMPVSTYINARVTKIATTEEGSIWRLEWDSIGNTVTYRIDKIIDGVAKPYIHEVTTTSCDLVIPADEEKSIFIIRANVGTTTPVPIESKEIVISEETLTPAEPVPAPEFVYELGSGEARVTYPELLNPDNATILWRAPRKADGSLYEGLSYDMWLVKYTDADDDSSVLPVSIVIRQENYVIDTDGKVVGYKYKIENLEPNTMYYVRMAAKSPDKDAAGNPVYSRTSEWTIVTPSYGNIGERPVSPGKIEPLYPTDEDMFDDTSTIKIQLYTVWYEEYVDAGEGKGYWKLVGEDYDPVINPPDGVYFRKVNYLPNVEFDLYYVEYSEWVKNNYGDADYAQLAEIEKSVNKVPGENFVKVNSGVKATIDGLDSNTAYVIWARAKYGDDLVSDPSTPIVLTTDPIIEPGIETPVVPVFNYSYAGDNYVDLGWNFNFTEGYSYRIMYGTSEDITQAKEIDEPVTKDTYGNGYFRIGGLSQNTLYHFWIKAVYTDARGQTAESGWSDALTIKTKPFIPPETPRGFGVKREEGSVTKNSITFEWIKVDGLDYILEVADNINYKNSVEYNAGSVSEYKIENLLSYHRYYVRLYAYDPAKDMRSQPTQTIIVRTSRSTDDYDSDKDQDIEDIDLDKIIVKDTSTVNGVWNVKIIGSNADKLIEYIMTDRKLDFKLDLSDMPAKASKISIMISSKVFDGLTDLKENLIIESESFRFIIRPGTLDKALAGPQLDMLSTFNYQILVSFSTDRLSSYAANLNFKTKVVGLEVNAYNGGNAVPVTSFRKPLKVEIPYTGSDWYIEGTTSAYMQSQDNNLWEKRETENFYDGDEDAGYVTFETLKTGKYAVADAFGSYYTDISGHIFEDAINNVSSVHEIKSISGKKFEPDKECTIGDAVKLMLDVMDYNYGNDYMTVAVKAGLIDRSDAGNGKEKCTRQKAIAMAVRLYEIKSGTKAKTQYKGYSIFKDMDKVDPALIERVSFAAENGIAVGKQDNYLYPTSVITRGEVMGLLERIMMLSGEI